MTTNYADDNFVSRSSPDVNVILSNHKSEMVWRQWYES